MPNYQFRGRKYDTGAVITGERAAQNSQSLAATLRAEKSGRYTARGEDHAHQHQ